MNNEASDWELGFRHGYSPGEPCRQTDAYLDGFDHGLKARASTENIRNDGWDAFQAKQPRAAA